MDGRWITSVLNWMDVRGTKMQQWTISWMNKLNEWKTQKPV